MFKKNHLAIFLGGFLLIFDQTLKYLSYHHQNYSFLFWKNQVGWEYLANRGVAFSFPVPNWLVIFLTPIIIIFLTSFFSHHQKISPWNLLGLSLIYGGTISNLIDRVLFGITIDYLRLITTVINLGDVCILVGTLILIFKHKKE